MLCKRKFLFGPTIVCRNLVSYIQGQSPTPQKREYFYFIDHQGQVKERPQAMFLAEISGI